MTITDIIILFAIIQFILISLMFFIGRLIYDRAYSHGYSDGMRDTRIDRRLIKKKEEEKQKLKNNLNERKQIETVRIVSVRPSEYSRLDR